MTATIDGIQTRSEPRAQGAAYLPLVGRLLIAAIFLWSGCHKLAMPKAVIGMIGATGLPFPVLGYGLSLAAELGAGSLLVLGFRTRWAAAALAVFTLATALIFHKDFGDRNQMNHFMKNLAMMGGLVQVVAFGGGALSLDAWFAARRPSRSA